MFVQLMFYRFLCTVHSLAKQILNSIVHNYIYGTYSATLPISLSLPQSDVSKNRVHRCPESWSLVTTLMNHTANQTLWETIHKTHSTLLHLVNNLLQLPCVKKKGRQHII
jgi:hypothetical protein